MTINLNTRSTSTPASEISSASFTDDSSGYSAEAESKALADILRNSPAAGLLGVDTESHSEEEQVDQLQGDPSGEQEAQESDESSENDPDKDKTEDESEDSDSSKDDTSTDAALPSEEDIDWEYKVPVTIDGKTEYKTLEEIRKGFATDQHLSQKGRELGELKKQVEQEKSEKMQEIVKLGTALHSELSFVETGLANRYGELSAQIEKARESGDTYSARELKEEREAVQEKYWEARNKREAQLEEVTKRIVADNEAAKAKALSDYSANIKSFIPDYSEKVAVAVRDFAIKEGIPESLLDTVYDPAVVKFINDYRKLKTAKDTGEVKRKAVVAVKSIPTKNGVSTTQRKQADASLRSQVLSGKADASSEMNFLKSISSIGRKL